MKSTDPTTFTPEFIIDELERINNMTQYEMCRLWRFAPSGHPYFISPGNPLWTAFKKKFDEYGGFTPAISKQLGFEE